MKRRNDERSPGSGGPDIKKKIAIVGAGQAGLQLGMSLLGDERHEVTRSVQKFDYNRMR